MKAKTSKPKWNAVELDYFKDLILKKREDSLKEIKRLENITMSDETIQCWIQPMPIIWRMLGPIPRSAKKPFYGCPVRINIYPI
jgi:hypothetical protein